MTDATRVETTAGRIEGRADAGHVSFRGIPYARPPAGRLRFAAPEPPEPWTGTRSATRFGTPCPQGAHPVPGMAADPPHDEDCLYLNVFTPGVDAGRRPVFFWIHGGGLTLGAGSQPLYHGGPLAERGDLVVVTLNYRLGALGYLYPGDRAESWGASANAGQLDQIAALEWVRDNIAAFGGDPTHVTIAGESAGAAAVGALLAMPSARGLFQRAVLQSGTANRLGDATAGDRLTDALLRELGLPAGDPSALRDVPAGRIVATQARAVARVGADRGFRPLLDAASLPRQPLETLRDGELDDVPLLVGTNRDEVKLFVPPPSQRAPLDQAGLLAGVRALLPNKAADRAGELVETYRKSREGRLATGNLDLLDAIQGDSRFRIPATRLAEARATRRANAWMYLFCQESPARHGALGACHALELPFVFGTLGSPGQDRFAGSGAQVEALSHRMMDAWIAFARTGDPRTPEAGDWAPYDAERRATLVFDAASRTVEAPLDEERAAWDGILH